MLFASLRGSFRNKPQLRFGVGLGPSRPRPVPATRGAARVSNKQSAPRALSESPEVQKRAAGKKWRLVKRGTEIVTGNRSWGIGQVALRPRNLQGWGPDPPMCKPRETPPKKTQAQRSWVWGPSFLANGREVYSPRLPGGFIVEGIYKAYTNVPMGIFRGQIMLSSSLYKAIGS